MIQAITTEVLPVFEPGRNVTFTYEEAATAGAPLKLGTGDYTVVPATATTDLVVGQSEHDVLQGRKALVGLTVGNGIRRFATTEAIPVGAFVAPAGDGTVDTATGAPVIGVVVKASTPDDLTVHVLVGVPYLEGE